MGCGVACIAGTEGCSLQSHAAHTAALWLGMQHSSAYRCSAFGMWDKACSHVQVPVQGCRSSHMQGTGSCCTMSGFVLFCLFAHGQ